MDEDYKENNGKDKLKKDKNIEIHGDYKGVFDRLELNEEATDSLIKPKLNSLEMAYSKLTEDMTMSPAMKPLREPSTSFIDSMTQPKWSSVGKAASILGDGMTESPLMKSLRDSSTRLTDGMTQPKWSSVGKAASILGNGMTESSAMKSLREPSTRLTDLMTQPKWSSVGMASSKLADGMKISSVVKGIGMPSSILPKVSAVDYRGITLADVAQKVTIADKLISKTAHYDYTKNWDGSLINDNGIKDHIENYRRSQSIQKDIFACHSALNRFPSDRYELERDTYGSKRIKVIEKNTSNVLPLDSLATTISTTDILTELSTDEVFDFYNHLVRFPMLGLQHEVGLKILNQIKETKHVEVENLHLFRCRARNIRERENPYSEIEMFEAPYTFAGHGRFNVNGQGELYTCDSKEVAVKEIASNEEHHRYEIVEWKLMNKVSFLDLTDSSIPLVEYCLFKKSSNNAQEYLLPNFIAQCAKFHQISGLVFSSTVQPQAKNYVFFDFERRWFLTKRLEINKRG